MKANRYSSARDSVRAACALFAVALLYTPSALAQVSVADALWPILEESTAGESDEGTIYRRYHRSVFLVEASAGRGTGFLVDPAGLLLTNFHIVDEARYIGVQIDKLRKYPGEILATDETSDLAVIRVHPDTVAGLRVLTPQLDAAASGPAVGTRVVAIGNPLSRESVLTAGIVGQVEETALISDVNINPGNSGGPILDLRGRVIAIATFGVQDDSGPGIAGAVRSHLAKNVLADARARLATGEPPAAELLPVKSQVSFPVDALRESLERRLDTRDYTAGAGKFQIFVQTPISEFHSEHVAEIRAARRQEKRRSRKKNRGREGLYDPAQTLFDWQRYAGKYEPVVTLVAMPELKLTGGSKAGKVFGALFGVVTPGRYRFKRDFRELKLLRDGEEVTPIFPGRACEAVSIPGFNSVNDIGCLGAYEYAPEVFAPGHRYQVRVYSEEQPDQPVTVDLDGALVARIHRDFEGFRSLVASSGSTATEDRSDGLTLPGERP